MVYYLETFVDKQRFAGTCYKATNWICLGDTTGRGKNDHTKRVNRSIKAVTLKHKDPCPACLKGKVYVCKQCKPLNEKKCLPAPWWRFLTITKSACFLPDETMPEKTFRNCLLPNARPILALPSRCVNEP
ncbi:MAG: DUF4338 domain-containing protein [Desulfatitalea sp.]|nr:DUF4338 domain-containing protein [Desulfatitalea sp.]